VKFENVDGAWLAVKADFQAVITHVNGRTVEMKTSVERKNIQINPTFGENDFKPDNIADGTRVSIIPFRIQYTWQNGKVVHPNGREVDLEKLKPQEPVSLVGKAAPRLKLKTLDGKLIKLEDYRGKVVMGCVWG